jgi:hypothetical protein
MAERTSNPSYSERAAGRIESARGEAMKSGNKAKLALSALLVTSMLTLVGCMQSVRIGNLLADPSHWANRSVKVSGQVQNSMGLLGTGAYQVNDGTGSIWVISRGSGVPGRGARVDTQGHVFQGVNFLGRNFAVALREDKHRVH